MQSARPGLMVLLAPRARKAQSEPPAQPVPESLALQASGVPSVPRAARAKPGQPDQPALSQSARPGQRVLLVLPALREPSEELESKAAVPLVRAVPLAQPVRLAHRA